MKIIKRVFVTAAILVIIAFIADFAILKPLLEKKIRKSLQNVEGKQIDFAGIRSRLLTGTVKIKELTLSNDQSAGSKNLRISLNEITFSGINIIKLLFRKDFSIRKVKISGFRIDAEGPFENMGNAPLVVGRNISIGTFEIDTDTVRIKNLRDIREILLSDARLTSTDIHINADDTLSWNNSGILKFNLPKSSLLTSDGNVTFHVYGASYDSGKIMIDSMHYKPNFPDYEFNNRYALETDRIEAIMKDIAAKNVNIKDLFSGNLICSNVTITRADLHAFRDKRKEASQENRAPFQELIRNFPGKLSIDSIYVSNGRIVYAEHDDGAAAAGFIVFNKLNLRVFNITNNAKLRNSGISLSLIAKARLMNSGDLKIELKTPIFDTNNTIFVKGSLDKFSIDELNPMLTNLVFVKARGTLEFMNFKFLADNHKSVGDMEMGYNNLQLTATGIEGNDSIKLKERIKTIIANYKVINSNPLPGNPLREGAIGFERDPRKFIFNYCFKSILSGIKSTILVNPPSQIQE
jgi:hypothetical protein